MTALEFVQYMPAMALVATIDCNWFFERDMTPDVIGVVKRCWDGLVENVGADDAVNMVAEVLGDNMPDFLEVVS